MNEAISLPVTLADIVGRLALAAVLGALVGIDREVQQKPAGLRTHALVALGAALLSIVSLHPTSPNGSGDALSRVIQGIVAGVGFIGGGVILKGSGQTQVQGLTTAASIWVVAALGIAAGVGLWRTAGLTAGIVLAVLLVGHPVRRWLGGSPSPRDGQD